jgi:hypothetical protein
VPVECGADGEAGSGKALARLAGGHVELEAPRPCGSVAIDWSDVRVGRGGRVRPVDPASRQEQIIAGLTEHPNAALREIARAVDVPPKTLRSVRARLPTRSR